jgi:hypothetical protein
MVLLANDMPQLERRGLQIARIAVKHRTNPVSIANEKHHHTLTNCARTAQ